MNRWSNKTALDSLVGFVLGDPDCMCRLINWRIERDDALGTLFFTFILLLRPQHKELHFGRWNSVGLFVGFSATLTVVSRSWLACLSQYLRPF